MPENFHAEEQMPVQQALLQIATYAASMIYRAKFHPPDAHRHGRGFAPSRSREGFYEMDRAALKPRSPICCAHLIVRGNLQSPTPLRQPNNFSACSRVKLMRAPDAFAIAAQNRRSRPACQSNGGNFPCRLPAQNKVG